MAQAVEFKYAPMFQLGKDDTEYYLLTKDYVSEGEFEGHKILKVQPEALTLLAKQAFQTRTLCSVALTMNKWPRF